MSPRRLHLCCPYLRKAPDTTLGEKTGFDMSGASWIEADIRFRPAPFFGDRIFRGSTLYPVALGHMCNQLYSSRLHTVTDCTRENIPSDRSRLWKSPCDT